MFVDNALPDVSEDVDGQQVEVVAFTAVPQVGVGHQDSRHQEEHLDREWCALDGSQRQGQHCLRERLGNYILEPLKENLKANCKQKFG